MEAVDRPKSEAIDLVAQLLGVRRATLRDWVRLQRPASRRPDVVERFLDVYDKIVHLQCESLKAEIFKMARAGERDGFKAATWLLARLDEEMYDPNYVAPAMDDDSVFSMSDVAQEVIDELTEEDRAFIEDLERRAAELQEEHRRKIAEAELRVRTADLARRSVRSS